jgi:hypothetical protein
MNIQLERGSNVSQMGRIAKNCGLSRKQSKKFYRAVKPASIRPWRWKGCYLASQQFLMDSSLGKELEYREGYCWNPDLGTHIQHAWLDWKGTILDLTYGYDREVNPENYHPYFKGDHKRSCEVVRKLWIDFGSFDSIANYGLLSEQEQAVFFQVRNDIFGPDINSHIQDWLEEGRQGTRKGITAAELIEAYREKEESARPEPGAKVINFSETLHLIEGGA